MSRIVIDAREWNTSTGRYMRSLIRELQKLATEDDYTVLLKPADMATWEPNRSNFKKVACLYREFSFGEQLGFKKQLNGLGADLVHFGMTHQPILYKGRAVTTIHDLTMLRFKNPSKNPFVFGVKQRLYKHVVKRVAKKSVALITPSQFTKDDVVNFCGVSPDKITVTHLGADKIEATAEPLEGLAGKQFLMYVGRPTPHKNLERLIEAFGLLKARHPDLRLVLAGKQDANYLRMGQLVTKQGLTGVIFTDHISEGQLRWLYENCQAYVFPSLSEGFGLPGLEAMAHGAPVVSSNATCLPEIYGEAAHYFDPLDVQNMTDAINEVLTDKNLRQNLIEKGRIQAAKYSWAATAQKTLAVYQGALVDK